MKYTIEQISNGEDELILRYQSLTKEVERILSFMNTSQRKLIGLKGLGHGEIMTHEKLLVRDLKAFMMNNSIITK